MDQNWLWMGYRLLQVAALGVVAYGLIFAQFFTPDAGQGPHMAQDQAEFEIENIAQDAGEIFHDEAALYAYVKIYGLKQTIEQLSMLSEVYGECHHAAHLAGRFAYEIFSTAALNDQSSECHSGGLHGAIEFYFKEHGVTNLAQDVYRLCDVSLNPFFMHQCVHGIGHGLMAWAQYELLDALQACEELPERSASCYSGVFMENVVGGLAGLHGGSPSKYLSDDPHYPCTVIPEKYRQACYFYQTSRMFELFNGDFAKVAATCAQVALAYQRVCFESMGRDVGGIHRGQPARAINTCAHAPRGEARTGCLVGAAQDAFWAPSGQDNALAFCKMLLQRSEKDACYDQIISRAPHVLATVAERQAFCAKVEPAYRQGCLDKGV